VRTLTDLRIRETAKELSNRFALCSPQSHIIHIHQLHGHGYDATISRTSIRGLSRCDKGKLLNTRSVQNKVGKYVDAAGKTEAIWLHVIRHTVVTNTALNEAPLLILQRLLGHSNSKTTVRCIRRAEWGICAPFPN
jgi:site-specific recombinase XerD